MAQAMAKRCPYCSVEAKVAIYKDRWEATSCHHLYGVQKLGTKYQFVFGSDPAPEGPILVQNALAAIPA